MARAFDGSSQYGSLAKALLSGLAGPWTISFWVRTTEIASIHACVFGGASGGNFWAVALIPTGSDMVPLFVAAGNSGDDLSALPPGANLSPAELATGAWITVRFMGAGGELAIFTNGTKTVIDASTTFTLPPILPWFSVGATSVPGDFLDGQLAEVALWERVALTDTQIAELAAGVAADQVAPGGLSLYLPLHGHSDPELNYAVAADVLTLTDSPTHASGPTIVPPWIADVVEPAWLVELMHPELGTVRAASRPLTHEHDDDTLGATYPEALAAEIRLIDQLPNVGLSVMESATTVVQLLNARGTFDQDQDWIGVPITIRYYDRVSHALTTAFSGVIDDQDIRDGRAVFTCKDQDEAALDQMIPRAVIEPTDGDTGIVDTVDGGTVRRDVGAPIPVPMGDGGLLFPPYIDVSHGTAVTDVNGHDLVVGYGGGVSVQTVRNDWDPNAPGLEQVSLWGPADLSLPGGAALYTLAHVSGSVFTVVGTNAPSYFEVGRPVRSSNNAGTTWNYAHVFATNMNATTGGTVTLSASILGPSLGTVQIAGDYSVHTDRYQYVSSGGTAALTTIRFYGSPNSAVLAQVSETTRGNPAEAIRFILSNADVGLGQTVNAASFDAAAAVFSAAGLGTAVRDVLGCDKQQRRARDVVNEIASLRRARVWKDGDTEEWHIAADEDPGPSVWTFEYGVGTRGNVAQVTEHRRQTLDNTIATVKLRYNRLGRDRGAKSMELTDYQHHCIATASGKGKELVLQNPWLRSPTGGADNFEPARVCYHIARTLDAERRTVGFRVRHQGRRVRLGDRVTLRLQSAPEKFITGDWRVLKIERTLTEFTFTCGVYAAAIWTTDSFTISEAVARPSESDINPDDPERGGGRDANLVLNADFSAGLRRPRAATNNDQVILPNWVLLFGTELDAIAVVTDARAIGGAYLECVAKVGDEDARDPEILSFNKYNAESSGFIAVRGDRNYILSVYALRPDAFRLRMSWYSDPDGTSQDVAPRVAPMRIAPGDVNGFGWRRVYAVFSAPSWATCAAVRLQMTRTPTSPQITHRFDAVEFEEGAPGVIRPSLWHRNAQYGLRPGLMTGGNLTVRGAGAVETGTDITVDDGSAPGTAAAPVVLAGGGSRVTVGTVLPGTLTGVTGVVTTGIAGGTAWYLALDYGGGRTQRLTSALGTAALTTFADAEKRFDLITVNAETPLVAIVAGGTAFTAGAVKVAAHRLQHIPASE